MTDRELEGMSEQDRYYAEAFESVNYEGAAGFATRLIHRRLEAVVPRHQHFATVLELGAAHGEHIAYVQHGFDRYIMTDLIDRGIDPSRHAPPEGTGLRRVELGIQDATRLEVPDASIDRVLHTCLLHHVSTVPAMFAEIRRVLRPGGLYTAYLPCDPGILYRAAQRVTTGRRIRRALRDGAYTMTPAYLRALEHPNHYAAIRGALMHAFRSDQIVAKHFPFPAPLWNLNFFSVVAVVRSPAESS